MTPVIQHMLELQQIAHSLLANAGEVAAAAAPAVPHVPQTLFEEFLSNVLHNLFKPLLLFFYAGFLIPILRVKFEFPKAVYQGLTIYLLLAIGWHGGEELALLGSSSLAQALGFMVLGFVTNTLVGILAYVILRSATKLRRIDAATVAGYYGSDSAGTFVTCVGVLTAANIAYAAYMPVLLAVMEIPGCLVALFLISRLRATGMDRDGNMPDEAGYNNLVTTRIRTTIDHSEEEELVDAAAGHGAQQRRVSSVTVTRRESAGHGGNAEDEHKRVKGEEFEAKMALEDNMEDDEDTSKHKNKGGFDLEVLHEVFFNPGIYLLFAGILIGFLSQLQGSKVTGPDDALFITLFQGMLCLFLLEMGMTASQRLKDLRTAGLPFVLFGILAPNLFATMGMVFVHLYSMGIGVPFDVGTYVLFGVLCGAASYIAVPAVQRLAIPEASPTLPLAASLGLTFSYNVTIGIPVYIMIAKLLLGQAGGGGAPH
ncbi:MAG: putative permease [Planctomycetaceae bacterium]|nr:putative permease [Planctomycetaceae bacterium]